MFQIRKKEEEVKSDGPRLNEKITAETVRLVSEEGNFCFIFSSFYVPDKETAKEEI